MGIVSDTQRHPFPRYRLSAWTFLLACLVSVQAQVRTNSQAKFSDLKPFVGTWKGEYKGQVFAILILHMDGEKLAGTLSTAETINLDSDGDIREVEGEATEANATPVQDATLTGSSLNFKNKSANDDEIETYTMQLSGDTAGLKPEAAPPSMKVKPFPLSRVGEP